MSYIRQAAGVFDARKGTPNEAYSVSAVLLNLLFQVQVQIILSILGAIGNWQGGKLRLIVLSLHFLLFRR